MLARLNKSLLNRARLGSMYLRGMGTRVLMSAFLKGGKGLLVGQNVNLAVYGDIAFGDNVTLADGCTLEVGVNGRLILGHNVFVGRHSVIRADEVVELRTHCIVAEHCTIRDQDHFVDPEQRRTETVANTAPVILEENVWIGAGVRVLKGSRIGRGSVVAANAVVRGDVPEGVVVGGIPARILRPAKVSGPLP